jgi:DNA-binding CsgD family transcriptional regulator
MKIRLIADFINYLAIIKTYFSLTQNLKLMEVPNRQTFLNNLTIKERTVLKHVTEGLTSKEIGRALFSSEMTVKKHRENIFRKADVKGTHEIRRFINEIRPLLD